MARLVVGVLSFSLLFSPAAVQAQSVIPTLLNLPVPGTMVQPSPAFVPVLLKGMTIHPEDPLKFDFIIDSGNTDFTPDEVKSFNRIQYRRKTGRLTSGIFGEG